MYKKQSATGIGEFWQEADDSFQNLLLRQVFTAGEKHLLFGVEFRDSQLDRVDFSDADLREAGFFNATLKAADFSGADLRGTTFIACDLREARFDRALFDRTRFDRSWFLGARGLSAQMTEYVRTRGGLLWFS